MTPSRCRCSSVVAHTTEVEHPVGWAAQRAKHLAIPENIRLSPLPPHAPELNPQEHIWDELREKEFPNRVFNHLDAVIAVAYGVATFGGRS
jgi:hypothetical protein